MSPCFLIIWTQSTPFRSESLTLLHRWGNWDLRRWNDLPRVIFASRRQRKTQVQDSKVQNVDPWGPQLFLIDSPGSSPNCAISWLYGLTQASKPWLLYGRDPISSEGFVSSVHVHTAASTGFTEKQLWLHVPWEALSDCPGLSYYPCVLAALIALHGHLSTNFQRTRQQTYVNMKVSYDAIGKSGDCGKAESSGLGDSTHSAPADQHVRKLTSVARS